jgi:hypothetical protein
MFLSLPRTHSAPKWFYAAKPSPQTRCATTTVHRALPPSKFKLAFASGASHEKDEKYRSKSITLTRPPCKSRTAHHRWHGIVGVINAVAAKAHQARSHEHSCACRWQFGCADLVFGGRVTVNEFFSKTRAEKPVRALIASRDKYRIATNLKIPFILISLANGCVLLWTGFILKASLFESPIFALQYAAATSICFTGQMAQTKLPAFLLPLCSADFLVFFEHPSNGDNIRGKRSTLRRITQLF